jgi:RNA polymerase sigma-70 factor (ECF subfamily)
LVLSSVRRHAVTNPSNLHPLSQDDRARSAEYAELVRAAAAGDEPAMERLLMRAQEVAFRFSLLVCGHAQDAEDVMQDALLKTYRYVRGIREPQAFRTWLYRTVRNACLMKRRRRAGEPAHHVSLEQGGAGGEPPVDVEDPARGPDVLAENAWLGERLQAALQALPPPYRVVVVLREVEGLSTRDVARVLEISEDNVKTRLHRARLLLRQHLEA